MNNFLKRENYGDMIYNYSVVRIIMFRVPVIRFLAKELSVRSGKRGHET